MSREMYESPEDREAEREVIAHVCLAWNCTAKKLPCPPYKVDWMLFHYGDPYAFAEVKCRTQYYEPYLIGLHKFDALVGLSRVAGLIAMVIVRWDGRGVHYADVSSGTHGGIRWMQDSRQREAADNEPCVAISGNRFRLVP